MGTDPTGIPFSRQRGPDAARKRALVLRILEECSRKIRNHALDISDFASDDGPAARQAAIRGAGEVLGAAEPGVVGVHATIAVTAKAAAMRRRGCERYMSQLLRKVR